jgi:hypothetical protein
MLNRIPMRSREDRIPYATVSWIFAVSNELVDLLEELPGMSGHQGRALQAQLPFQDHCHVDRRSGDVTKEEENNQRKDRHRTSNQ